MTQDSALFNHTLDKIIKNRLPAAYHKIVTLTYREEMNGYHEQVKEFIIMVIRVARLKTVFPGSKKSQSRRLFYVALTRAKEKLFLITEKGKESSFIKEIPQTFTVRHTLPVKAVMQEIHTCKKCFSQLEKLWKICPYCGVKIDAC